MRSHRMLMTVGTVLVLLIAGGIAQTRQDRRVSAGHIRGAVTDAQGAALPGVEVKLIPVLGGAERKAVTNEKGEFSFQTVDPGSYRIAAMLTGFRRTQTTVSVAAGQTSSVSITLEVGAVTETVTVAGAVAAGQDAKSVFSLGQSRVAVASPSPQYVVVPPPGRGRGFNTESYDRIEDNAWSDAATKPLSTFSIDVDTASYANVRRFLTDRQLPPKDAVRIEELINYFSFDYPAPDARRPFSVTTAVAECPWSPTHRLALVGLQARRIDSSNLPPRNLVFLIDVSGSMNDPQKLPLVKASLSMLARNLTERDRLAIVVYAGAAGLVLPSTPGSDTEAILEALGRLEAGGSTNGAGGIRLAYDVARTHFIKGGVNRVILATDGDFNVGVTNQGDLTRLIEEQRLSGVNLSVLGFGMGNYKDSTLEKLADKGDGNYSYIDTLQEAEKVLVNEAGGTLVTVAKDVKLQIEFNPKTVGAYRLIGYENRVLADRDFNDDKKDAGDMGAGHSVTALYELIPPGEPLNLPGVDPLKYQRPGETTRAASSDELMTVKLRYKEPSSQTSELSSTVVANRLNPTPELGFASAVAEFGMVLRDSEHKGTSTFAHAASMARRYKGEDPHGHRAEFIRLIERAASLSATDTTVRR